MNLQEKTWNQIESYLQSKKTILLPVGSTEQHGPTGLIGIDYMSSWSIAEEVGKRTHTLVAPPLCFGMAVHHMAFPGTMTLSPLTYVQVITELIQSLATHGFQKIILVNGHGGNIAPITTAFCQVQQKDEKLDLQLINWWHLPEVQKYESEVFGEENGFHATCGEISVTQFTHPKAYAEIPQQKFQPTAKRSAWPLSPVAFRQNFPDGRMGSNPELASPQHGEKIFEIAVQTIQKKLEN